MKSVFEKIIERLENHVKYCEACHEEFPNAKMSLTYEVQLNSYKNAIEIVNQAAEEYDACYKGCGECEAYDKEKHYCPKFCQVIKETVKEIEENKDGWIPCSERLPENDFENVIVWFEYFRYGEYNRLFQTYGISYTYKGAWSGIVNGSSGWQQLRIIAWQPLPAPYQPKETEV